MTAGDRTLPMPPSLPEPEHDVRIAAGGRDVAAILGRLRTAALAHLALGSVLALAAVAYLWNLTVSGYANTYYAMAAQAAAQDWGAFFFGSLDAGNFITLDKPPAAVWLMALSVRILGLSSWSVLLPQALLGIASVGVLFLAVRRPFGTPAAVLAGVVMALTPAAALIFRYDNPDALLTFVLVVGAWALGRGLEDGRLRWPILAASLVGVAFLTKYLQAYVVLPAFALVWLVAAPGSVRRRLAGLAAAALTVVVTSGWWVAIVELIPASARPFIGGSTNDSVLDLILGYDGLGRIFGQGIGGGAAGGAGPRRRRSRARRRVRRDARDLPHVQRPVRRRDQLADPARPDLARRRAGHPSPGPANGPPSRRVPPLGDVAGRPRPRLQLHVGDRPPVLHRHAGPGDRRPRRRAAWPTCGGNERATSLAGVALAAGVVGSAAWGLVVLGRVPSFVPGLGLAAVAAAVAAGLVLVLPAAAVDRRVQRAALGLGVVAILAGPAAFSAATMSRALAGGDPSAGPAASGSAGFAGFAGGSGLGGPGGPRSATPTRPSSRTSWPTRATPPGSSPPRAPGRRRASSLPRASPS